MKLRHGRRKIWCRLFGKKNATVRSLCVKDTNEIHSLSDPSDTAVFIKKQACVFPFAVARLQRSRSFYFTPRRLFVTFFLLDVTFFFCNHNSLAFPVSGRTQASLPVPELKFFSKTARNAKGSANRTFKKETYLWFAFRHAICHIAGFQIQSVSLQQKRNINYITL